MKELIKNGQALQIFTTKSHLLTNRLENSLTDFISARAIDLMFMMVANEEAEIRTKYELRKTDLMKKVFTYAEKELKKENIKKPSSVEEGNSCFHNPGWVCYSTGVAPSTNTITLLFSTSTNPP